MSTYLLVTPDAAFEQRIRGAISEIASNLLMTRIDTIEEVAATLKAAPQPVDVVAVGPGVALDHALKAAHQLDLDHPEVSVLLVAEQPTPDLRSEEHTSELQSRQY